jgi:hypothetical protein
MNRRGNSILLLGAVALTTLAATSAAAQEHLRPWVPGDSPEVRLFSWDMIRPFATINEQRSGEIKLGPDHAHKGIVASPDGRYFFTLSSRGDLITDRVFFDLDVYDAALTRALVDKKRDARSARVRRITLSGKRRLNPDTPERPAKVAFDTTSGLGRGAGIENPHWTNDGKAILFTGVVDDVAQPFRLDVVTGRVTQLAQFENGDAGGLVGFDARAGHIAYVTRLYFSDFTFENTYPQSALLLDQAGNVPHVMRGMGTKFSAKLVSRDENEAAPLPLFTVSDAAALSPDGRRLALRSGQNLLLLAIDGASPREELKIPLVRVKLYQPSDPVPWPGQFFWTSDGQTLVAVGVKGVEGQAEPSIAAYDLRSREWNVIAPLGKLTEITAIGWNEAT